MNREANRVRKKQSSAFIAVDVRRFGHVTNKNEVFGTHNRVRNVLIAGVNTNVCVESTLRDAYHREYFAVMVADATFQSGPPMMMDATIFNVETFFGWVTSVDELCGALSRTLRPARGAAAIRN